MNCEIFITDCRLIGKPGHELCSSWGKYLPLLWNCQHFAIFLTQIAVDTEVSARMMCHLLIKRARALDRIRKARNAGLLGFAVASSTVPVVGGVLGLTGFVAHSAYTHADSIKDSGIITKVSELFTTYDELMKMKLIYINSPLKLFDTTQTVP